MHTHWQVSNRKRFQGGKENIFFFYIETDPVTKNTLWSLAVMKGQYKNKSRAKANENACLAQNLYIRKSCSFLTI